MLATLQQVIHVIWDEKPLLAENDSNAYEAYVSEQNLLIDESGDPVNHPQVAEVFGEFLGASYALPDHYRN